VIDTRTNMTWLDDPYRTAQQLYRRPVPRLAAFAMDKTGADRGVAPAAVAVVYLPLHRTKAVEVTEQTLTFGFRLARANEKADLPALAKTADLDLMQARRHAAILAGHGLAPDLATLRSCTDSLVLRGLESVEHDWAVRMPVVGQARMFDSALDLPGRRSLEGAAHAIGIESGPMSDGQPATLAVERALTAALVCARHLGRYEWAGSLRISEVVASVAWDCLTRHATETEDDHQR
jgi:hypothetical protein